METIDPIHYNLSPRTKLLKDESGTFFILVDRKSRVVMKDGHRVVSIAEHIKEVNQNTSISLLTSAPICSKTKKFLLQNNITIQAL
jgi:hypothetical protein